MNEQYSLLAKENEIRERVATMARLMVSDFPDTSPLFIALLRGAAPFTSLLMNEIVKQSQDYHPELDYMMVSTYGTGQKAGEPHIVTDLAPDTIVNDRTVIVLDDVLDKGVTANIVFHHLRACGARQIKLAVLCTKNVKREYPIEADYSCFKFGDNWLVGMGMDDAKATKEGYRWLDEIWEIKCG